MGMNRKWNMKVFELHDPNGGQGGNTDIPTPPQNDDVFVDTSGSAITMSKYPFTADGMIPSGADPSSILEIDLKNFTKDPDFLDYITNSSNWHFKEGSSSQMNIEQGDDTKITFLSVVSAYLDLPTESPRWVLKFDLHTNPRLYRSFFFFDGVEDETQTAVQYGYGIDIPATGYPHLEKINVEDGTKQVINQTVADEQYFTGATDMPIVVTRWDNTYTLYYDNRYMITIPTDDETLNRIGFWAWSGSDTYIKNPELYIIDDDFEVANIIIKTDTSDDDFNESDNGESGNGEPSGEASGNTNSNKYTINKVWEDNNNEAGLRPDLVRVRIYTDRVIHGLSIRASGSWTNGGNFDIVNDVEEDPIDNYTLTSKTIENNVITLVNTLNQTNTGGGPDVNVDPGSVDDEVPSP